jgi:transcriptional regulator with XRE-family HTH domain
MGKELGLRITEMLQKRNMKQRDLAKKINITEAQLSRYISGDREPKPTTIANIATALQTTSDYLLGIEDEAFNHSKVRRIIARNSALMTDEEKRALINAIFGEE